MRPTETNDRTRQNSMITMMRTFSLAVLSLSLGLAMSAGPARAGDDDRTMSEKISDGFYGMIRGTNMDNRGIDYRERSPLVVPPTLDLPPPASASANAQIANWPKDPDERAAQGRDCGQEEECAARGPRSGHGRRRSRPGY